MTVGIMSEIDEEIQFLLGEMKRTEIVEAGRRTYHKGILWGTEAVLVAARRGNISAATTATFLIEHFEVNQIILTGVADRTDDSVEVGDVVIANRNCQQVSKAHERSSWSRKSMASAPLLHDVSVNAAAKFLTDELRLRISPDLLAEYRIRRPKVVEGYIPVEDQCCSKRLGHEADWDSHPGIPLEEKVGAAVIQVCHEYGVPVVVIRTVSESNSNGTDAEFPKFVKHVVSPYSHGILKNLLIKLSRPTADASTQHWPTRAYPGAF